MDLVDIIIPTFNRSSLLEKTIPSYIQDGVQNIFLIDDCSTDNTEEIASSLCGLYPQINYRRLPFKGRQMGAKNLGLKISTASYVYFGDDDSILIDGSIKSLLQMAANNPDCIIAARHIYMNSNDVLEKIISRNANIIPASDSDIYNPNTMKLDLSYVIPEHINLPFCQACFLVSGKIARSFHYDEKYIGTCFREETDYIVSLRKSGVDLIVCNEALQINLPRSVSGVGGTASVPFWYRHVSEIINEFRFFSKHGKFLKNYVSFHCSPLYRSLKHLYGKMIRLHTNKLR
jgi:glycosyltransferase involved in cell wall biosynthesis